MLIKRAVLGVALLLFARGSWSAETDSSAVFRGNVQRTGNCSAKGVPDVHGLKWTSKIGKAGEWVSCALVCAEGLVFAGTMDGRAGTQKSFVALDAASGKPRWKTEVPGDIHGCPQYDSGVVYFAAQDWTAFAYEAASGKKLWEKPGLGEMTVAGGVAYCLAKNAIIAADAKTGAEQWKVPVENTFSGVGPALADGLFYFLTKDGVAHALDLQTRQEKWKFSTSGALTGTLVIPAIAAANGKVYAPSRTHLFALDAKTGEEKGRHPLPQGNDAAPYCAPAVAEGLCVVTGVAEGPPYVYACDSSGKDWYLGPTKWFTRFKSHARSSPSIAGGLVYCGCYDGTICAMDLSAGKEKWNFKIEHNITTPLTVGDGTLYFGDSKGNVYALE